MLLRAVGPLCLRYACTAEDACLDHYIADRHQVAQVPFAVTQVPCEVPSISSAASRVSRAKDPLYRRLAVPSSLAALPCMT